MRHAGQFFLAILFSVAGMALPSATGLAETGAGDSGTIRQEVDALKTDLEAIKRQLGEIQKQLTQRQAQPAPAGPVTMSVGDGPSIGSANAPITIVEFSDYQCPFCKRHFLSTLSALKVNYIDTGKVRYVFRDFPLDSIHPYARKAAEAAHCAGDQGKYWEMHDTMFTNQEALKPDNLLGFARDMKLDLDAFNACLDSGKHSAAVAKNLADGSAVGIGGTPGFFIGKTQQNGTIEAMFIKGAQPVAVFNQVIDRLLDEKKIN
jgi:protein-disulfide isomerase